MRQWVEGFDCSTLSSPNVDVEWYHNIPAVWVYDNKARALAWYEPADRAKAKPFGQSWLYWDTYK